MISWLAEILGNWSKWLFDLLMAPVLLLWEAVVNQWPSLAMIENVFADYFPVINYFVPLTEMSIITISGLGVYGVIWLFRVGKSFIPTYSS